jgi:peptidoglycan/LPS O-acetylase OafA/YrhL
LGDEPGAARGVSAGVRGGSEHLAPLDGLRGIAIALVVWFHLWEITWLRADVHLGPLTLNFNAIPEAGFVGVDLFFFLSGFVLFSPYARALFDGGETQTLATFAARRAFKILPSYALSIGVAIAFGWAHFASAGDAAVQLASHAFFVHIWSNDTFGGINGVLWSLAIEVQFYVLFPAIAWCAMRRPLSTFAALGAIGLGYRLIISSHPDALHQMQQLPGTIDLFAAGMFAAYIYRALATCAPKLASRRPLWTAVAIVGVVASAFVSRGVFDARIAPNWPTSWYVWGRTELAASFVVLTIGSLYAVPLWQRALANPVLTFLSLISYNLYLYHQLIARALVAAHVPEWVGGSEKSDGTWGITFSIVALAVSLGVAWVVTVAIEIPLVRRGAGAIRAVEPNFSSARV